MPAPATPLIRILLIDDHQLVRTGLRIMLERHPQLAVVGEAGNRADALAIAARERPDILLLDLDLGGASSLDFLPELLDAAQGGRVLLVTGVRAPEEHYRAVQLGAMGLVRKEQAAEVLVQAIEHVHAGEVWLEPAMVTRALAEISGQRNLAKPPVDPEAAKIARLTPRETEVIGLIGEGLYNKQIAERLSISAATVSHHLTSIFDKLGVANRFDLVIYAYRHGLADSPR
jgi:two-component system, NarL family, nitrate/nitrite response regulator NarL